MKRGNKAFSILPGLMLALMACVVGNATTAEVTLTEDFAAAEGMSDDHEGDRAFSGIVQELVEAGDIAGALATAQQIKDSDWRGLAVGDVGQRQLFLPPATIKNATF